MGKVHGKPTVKEAPPNCDLSVKSQSTMRDKAIETLDEDGMPILRQKPTRKSFKERLGFKKRKTLESIVPPSTTLDRTPRVKSQSETAIETLEEDAMPKLERKPTRKSFKERLGLKKRKTLESIAPEPPPTTLDRISKEGRLLTFKRQSSKASESPPNLTDCISEVDIRIHGIEKKIGALDQELKKYKDQLAKMEEGSPKNAVKQKAMRILKQRKMYESQLDKLRQQLFNMEQAEKYATQKDTKATNDVMTMGKKQIKKELKKVNIKKIEDAQENLADILNQSQKVQEAMGRNLRESGDDELEAELAALLQESSLDEVPSCVAPNVPSREPGAESIRNKDGEPADEFEKREKVQEAMGRSYNRTESNHDEFETEFAALLLVDDFPHLDNTDEQLRTNS